ncbi:14045_t:CDS:2, partial [Ambispora leptoticha]
LCDYAPPRNVPQPRKEMAYATFGRAVEVVQAANRLKKNATKKPDSDEEELQ